MAKIKKRRLQWQSSPSLIVVGYKLYRAVEGMLNYDSQRAMIGNVGEIILSGGILSFRLVKGATEIGITAVNEIGNESDMAKVSFPFQFDVPDAPANLALEAVNDYFVSESIEDPESSENER